MPSGMILAAGLGTRLRPLTDELPKPLVWLGDRPMVAHAAAALSAAGVAPVVLNTHHLAGAFRPVLADLGLVAVHEPAILGTAGGVANAAGVLGEGDVVVWNGDIAADVDVAALFAAHAAAGALATLVIAPRAPGEGTVGVDAAGALVRLRGERFGAEARGGDFLGVHLVGAALRARLPRVGCMVGDVYLPALRAGERLATLAHARPWHDVGALASYVEANGAWLDGRGLAAYVGPGADVAPGVELRRAVVGAGARVAGEGTLSEVVVWPGATAEAPLARAVVTPRGVVALTGAVG